MDYEHVCEMEFFKLIFWKNTFKNDELMQLCKDSENGLDKSSLKLEHQ